MATTRTYKNVRLTSQLINIICIITSTCLLAVRIYEHPFFRIEEQINMGFVDMNLCYQYTVILNMIMAFFSSCAISSKVRQYMRLYLVCGFIGLSFLLGFILFMFLFYKEFFLPQLSISYSTQSTQSLVVLLLKCDETGPNDCKTVARKKCESLVKIFVLMAGLCFVLQFVGYVLTRLALMVDMSKPTIVPRFERNVQIGHTSESLRRKRVVDLVETRQSVLSHGV